MPNFIKLIFTNWKTSLSGTLGAIGAYWLTVPELHTLGVLLVGASPLLIGLFSKDSNVTGGTKPNATPTA